MDATTSFISFSLDLFKRLAIRFPRFCAMVLAPACFGAAAILLVRLWPMFFFFRSEGSAAGFIFPIIMWTVFFYLIAAAIALLGEAEEGPEAVRRYVEGSLPAIPPRVAPSSVPGPANKAGTAPRLRPYEINATAARSMPAPGPADSSAGRRAQAGPFGVFLWFGLLFAVAIGPWPERAQAIAVFALLAIAALAIAFSGPQLGRMMQDMPTSRVRSAAQGYVELKGTARAGSAPLHCPAGGEPCVWFDYRVSRRDWFRTAATLVVRETSQGSFRLDDQTGICSVMPAEASVEASCRHVWYGSEKMPNEVPGLAGRRLSAVLAWAAHAGGASWVPAAALIFLAGPGGQLLALCVAIWAVTGLLAFRYRYEVRLIRVGDPLHAWGRFRTRTLAEGQMHELLVPSDERPFILSTLSEEQYRKREGRAAPAWLLAFIALMMLAGWLFQA